MPGIRLKKYLYVLVVLAIIFIFSWKPATIISQVNEPDQNSHHIRKVYKESRIGQTIDVPAGYISQIELKILKKDLPDNTPIIMLIKKTPKDTDKLLQIDTTLADTQTGDKITFVFKPLARKKLYFEVIAPTLKEKDCLAIRYQIDSEKYSGNQTYINGQPAYGDLAFSIRSSPPAFFLATSYISKHPTTILAIILFCVTIPALRLKQTGYYSTNKLIPKNTKEWAQIVIIFIFTIAVFIPLSNLYFRQDDFVILDRARTMLTKNPVLLFTNRGFVEASRSDLPVHIAFYRPISNSIVPALLYKAFGTNALPHYLFSLLIHALSAVGVYYIFRHFIAKNVALFSTLIWATHSAVLATVSWLSSIQELLSAFFLIFSLLSLSLFWDNKQKRYWAISVILYVFAILSKENAFLFLAIAPLFLFFTKPEPIFFREKIRMVIYHLSPYFFSSTIALLIRNWMLDESGLRTAMTDVSYKLSTNPLVIIGNIFSCFTWAIQGWIINIITKNPAIGNYLIKIEETTGWMYFPPLPILAVLLILIVFVVAGFVIRKDSRAWRFPVAFYFFACLPFLMLLNERKATWQYLPLIGLILLMGISLQNYLFLNKIFQNKYLLTGLIILIALESNWALNNYPFLIEAKKQSAFTKQAIFYLRTNYPSIPKSTEVVIANVPKDRRQNLGYAAIPLLYDDSTLTTSYPDNPPKEMEQNKIYLIYSEESNTISELNFQK